MSKIEICERGQKALEWLKAHNISWAELGRQIGSTGGTVREKFLLEKGFVTQAAATHLVALGMPEELIPHVKVNPERKKPQWPNMEEAKNPLPMTKRRKPLAAEADGENPSASEDASHATNGAAEEVPQAA